MRARIIIALPLFVACQGSGETDPGSTPDVRVNELMASNKEAVEAPDGSFPDWFELANFDAETVDLSGATLTDDAAEPGKFTFPEGSEIAPGEYLVLWADGDGLAEDSVSFKLSADGESIVLSGPNGSVWDAVEFAAQDADVAWGRSPDGGDVWATVAPSPGEPNP